MPLRQQFLLCTQDDDLLSTYKIQSSHTIHMVKGAAKNNSGTSSTTGGAATSPSASQAPRLPTMQAGQNPTDPLTILNGPMGHGILNSSFNPFADLGVNPNDPNMVRLYLPDFVPFVALRWPVTV